MESGSTEKVKQMLWGKLKVNRQPQYMINMEKTTSGNWHMLKYN